MKARFTYGDGPKDYINLDVPEHFYHLERLTYISCEATGKEAKIYDKSYKYFTDKVLKFFLQHTNNIPNPENLQCEIAIPPKGYKLAFDIVYYP
jgi:hypothetical protein